MNRTDVEWCEGEDMSSKIINFEVPPLFKAKCFIVHNFYPSVTTSYITC